MAMLMTSLDKIFGLMTTPSCARKVTQVLSGAVSLRMLCCAMLMATLGFCDAVRAQQDVVFEPPVERDLTVAEISEEVSRFDASRHRGAPIAHVVSCCGVEHQRPGVCIHNRRGAEL